MDDAVEPTQPSPGLCPDCGAAVQRGQRRCTNCGGAVAQRRLLPRRTPLIAAIAVAAIGGAAAVVAQAEVTERATEIAATTPDAAGPIPVAAGELPPAERRTHTPPKVEEPDEEPPNALEIPTLDTPVVQEASEARGDGGIDGENTDDDVGPDPDDLDDPERIKVKKAFNFDPKQRVGVEFGKPKAAIDKRSRTVWDVNVPADGQDFGVGIVLDLGETQRVSTLKISTPTPGFGAVIYRADAEERPEQLDDTWTRTEKVRNVRDELELPLADEPVWTRYILVLLTTPRDPQDTRVAIGNLEVLP